jgi:hypothetical protein
LLTAFAVFLGPLFAALSLFGENWSVLLLLGIQSFAWNIPVLLVLAAAFWLIWQRRGANPRAARLALFGMGSQMAILYSSLPYTIWLQKALMGDPSGLEDRTAALANWYLLYDIAYMMGTALSWMLVGAGFAFSLRPAQQANAAAIMTQSQTLGD